MLGQTGIETAQSFSVASAGVMMEVKQQHVDHKPCDKPSRCFHNSLKSWRHQERIRLALVRCPHPATIYGL